MENARSVRQRLACLTDKEGDGKNDVLTASEKKTVFL